MQRVFTLFLLLFLPSFVLAAPSLQVRQGDIGTFEIDASCKSPAMRIPKLGTFPIFVFQNKHLLTVPIDLRAATGTFEIPSCANIGTSTITVLSRTQEQKIFVITEEQGGNTKANAKKISAAITYDARIFSHLFSHKKQLWSEPFIFPVDNPEITDTYGYIRDSQGITVVHKGIDFHADLGTPVYAMNRGVVRYLHTLPTYGKTMIIDHGRGVQTIYLHLSKASVSEGAIVRRGQLVARSGASGFVSGPHLHLSIHVSGISVDPESFMKVFGER
jgi:murein DD-endopeptidase MepM/ murein hydrolase activator NlpD